jgi:hypothetical protein
MALASSDITPSLIVAVFAAIAATTSAIVAIRSSRIASRALALAQKQREDREREFQIYLIDGFVRKESGVNIYSFALSLVNQSDIGNSLIRLDLEIYYVFADGRRSHLNFPLVNAAEQAGKAHNLQPLSVPVSLGARATLAGWVSYPVQRNAITGTIDYYAIVGITALGNRVEQKVYLVREIYDES